MSVSTSSDGVLEFLAAVHAADEQTARAAEPLSGDFAAEVAREDATDDDRAHIARHDPQSVLARVQAERMLVELHRPDGQAMCPQCRDNSDPYEPDGRYVFDCPSLRVLAWGYRGREGFDPAWTPDGVEVGA